MRGPVTSVGPAADVVLRDFGLSYQAFGVLNALPVLAFGLFSFPAVTLSERIGMHKTIAAALGWLLLGTLCRVTESMALLFAGTVFVGAGIAFLNVLVPVLLKAQAPDKAARAMGLYTVVVGLSGTIGTWTSAPLAHLADSHIAVMAVWLAFIVPALCLWPRVKTDDAAKAAAADKGGMVRLIKTGAAWAVILTMGMQSLTVYTTCAWLPTALTERGFTTSAAGLAVAFFLFCSLPGSLWLDAIIRRLGSLKRTAVLMTVMFLAGIACWQAGGWRLVGVAGLLSSRHPPGRDVYLCAYRDGDEKPRPRADGADFCGVSGGGVPRCRARPLDFQCSLHVFGLFCGLTFACCRGPCLGHSGSERFGTGPRFPLSLCSITDAALRA